MEYLYYSTNSTMWMRLTHHVWKVQWLPNHKIELFAHGQPFAFTKAKDPTHRVCDGLVAFTKERYLTQTDKIS